MRVLSPRNLVDYLRLLGWLLLRPAHLRSYQEQGGEKLVRVMGSRLVGGLIWLPLLVPSLAMTLNRFPLRTQEVPYYPWFLLLLPVGVLFGWGVTHWLEQFDPETLQTKKPKPELLIGIIVTFFLIFGVGSGLSIAGSLTLGGAVFVAVLVAAVVAPILAGEGVDLALLFVRIGFMLGGIFMLRALGFGAFSNGWLIPVFMIGVAGPIYLAFRGAYKLAVILATSPEGILITGLRVSLLLALVLAYAIIIGVSWLNGWRTISAFQGEKFSQEPFQVIYPSPTPDPRLVGGRPVWQFGSVTQVIDGQTIEVDINGQRQLVRYLGIDIPETETACGALAAEFNRELVESKQVRLETDIMGWLTTPEGHLLRYVYVGELFVNATLIEKGYANNASTPPHTLYAADFEKLEAQAREARVGCHTGQP